MIRKEKDAHSRIIWGCSWSHDDAFFTTVSREKHSSIKLWKGLESNGDQKIGDFISEVPDSLAPSATAV